MPPPSICSNSSQFKVVRKEDQLSDSAHPPAFAADMLVSFDAMIGNCYERGPRFKRGMPGNSMTTTGVSWTLIVMLLTTA